MKRIKLLLAAIAAMVSLGVHAQGWTAQAPADGDFYLYNVGAGKFLSCGSEYWGTKACIDNGGLNFTLANNGAGAYTLYTTSTFSYGNPNAAQLQSGGYVDQNVTATTWTFVPVDGLENTYTLLNAAGTYLVAPSNAKSILLNADAPTDAYGYWKLINRDNLFPETASEENPSDITCLIGDANFESSNDKMESFWTVNASNCNLVKGHGGSHTPNNAVESWQSAFTVSQTITVPNGNYRLRAQGWIREYTVTGTDYPVVYITSGTSEKTSPFIKMKTETASLSTVEDYFFNGDGGEYFFTDWTETLKVTNGSITIGAKGTRTNSWNVYDNFQLQYVGPIDLTEYKTALADAVSAAEATNGTIPTAAYNAIAAVVTENNKEYTTEEEYTTAIVAINNAVSTYASSAIVAAYSYYQAVRTAVLAVDGSIDVSAADALANDGTDADLDDALASIRGIFKTYLATTDKTNVDLTAALLVNPSFETGDFTGWTNNGMVTQTNESFAKDGNYYCEHWQPNGTFGVSQKLMGMPSGVYRLTVDAKTRGVSSGKVFAGGIEVATKIADQVNNYAVEFACDNNADITFGFEGTGTGAGSSWLALDNFHLTLVSAGLPDVEAVTGKMNAEIAAAQTSAIETYEANKTVANYNAASAAIAAAQASKDIYATIPAAIEKANAVKNAHNFASAAATTNFADAIAAMQTGYDEATLTNDQASAAATTLGVAVTEWHGNNNSAAAVYLRDGFALGDFAADPALHVNTWSTEGANDGTDFVVPFYESWTSDANSLPNSTITGTLTDLPNGLYTVSAWVRVRAKNGVAADEATGVTMDVNGGGEGDYAAVDVTEGAQIGESQFQMQTYTAQNLVKDGNLTLNFNIVADNNISWLSFKNVHYTKVRDLTPEEAAIIPTAIALDQTEVALDATTSSKTFELTFTPNDATQAVNWTSSDESVATVSSLGVVTAVLPGTAIITATSTLDANVSASATVTVTFPETDTPANYYVNNNATRTVYTLGENLIKNGTFEYPDGFYGWTDATAGAAKLTSSKFEIVTDGDTKYLKAKASEGSTAAGSIGTSWSIESGKTYVFGYRVKANQTIGDKSKYHKLTLTNALGTETAQVSDDNTPVTNTWSNVQYTFTNTDGYAFVQFRARWLANDMSFDDFYLAEVTPATEGNVDYATAAIPTANIGTGAFQYSQDAIDNANALVQGEASVADVEAAYEAVTTINEPADGQLFHVVLTYAGWTYDNKAMTYIANGRTDAGKYNIQYKEAANTNLAQAFTFTKVSGNNYKMSQIDADGNARYICTGVPYSGNTGQIRTTTEADDALVVTVIPTTTDGKWNLLNTEANNYIGSQDAGVYTVNSHIDFNIIETQEASVVISTTEAGWGTLMVPFAVAKDVVPAEVNIYTCADYNSKYQLTLTEVESLEPNTPYIIEGAWETGLTGDAQGTTLTYNEGLLTGVYAATKAPAGSYVLQKNNDVVGFYQVADGEGKQPTVPANRAYLTVPSEVKALAFFFDEGTATAIQSVFSGVAAGEIYDLSGRKLNKLQKGVNIVNGKKVMVK